MIAFMEFGKPLEDSCDLESMSVGMSVQLPARGLLRRVQRHDVSIVKQSDDVTTELLGYLTSGREIDEAAIEVYRDEDSAAPSLVYLLKKIQVTSIHSMGGHDHVGLNCATVTTRLPQG